MIPPVIKNAVAPLVILLWSICILLILAHDIIHYPAVGSNSDYWLAKELFVLLVASVAFCEFCLQDTGVQVKHSLTFLISIFCTTLLVYPFGYLEFKDFYLVFVPSIWFAFLRQLVDKNET